MVELMISIAIMMLMTGLLLFNYPESAIRMNLINSVQTTALLVREAQVRGSAIDSVNSSIGGYGVYIKIVDANTLSVVKLFGDSVSNSGEPSSYGLPIGNGLYDITPTIDETNSTTSFPKGYNITKICVGQAPSVCSSSIDTSLTISFIRPSARPNIYLGRDTANNYSKACIEFKSPIPYSVGHIRSVEVYNSGMIRTAIASCI